MNCFRQKPKKFRSWSEKGYRKNAFNKICFLSKLPYEHVEFGWQPRLECFLHNAENVLLHVRKWKELFFSKLFLPKKFHGKKRSEIWQPCRKEMRRPKHSCLFSENDKNLTHKKKHFLSSYSKGHVKCRLDIFAETMTGWDQNNLPQGPKLTTEKIYFQRKIYCSSKRSSVHVECIFDNLAWELPTKNWSCLGQ